MVAIPSFIFGGNTGETPETLARKREIALAIMGNASRRTPQNFGEGLASLGQALSGRFAYNALDKEQKAGEGTATALFNSIIGGGASSGSPLAGTPVASAGAIPPGDPNAIQSQFIDTVKGGVTNPYGLAAVAATGKAESGYDPKNAGGTWADGVNPAGGIMSWNGPRLANLQKFAGGSNGSPEQQGKFFLQENPNLIASLNSAKSVDEAQRLMNNAWAFKGYNQPGNSNVAHRLALANGYLPQFQGSPQASAAPPADPMQVASLDPSAGMGGAPQPQAYVDPQANSPFAPKNIPIPTARPQIDPATTAAIAPPQGNPPLSAPVNIPSQPISNPTPAAPVAPQQVAQNTQFGGVDPRLLQAMSNPFLNSGQKATIQLLINQQQQAAQQAAEQQTWMARQKFEQDQKAADPLNQAQLANAKNEIADHRTPEQIDAIKRGDVDYETAQKQNDPAYKLKLKTDQAAYDQANASKGEIKVVGNKAVLFPRDGSTPVDVTPNGGGIVDGKPRFDGTTIEGQSLNYLVDTGKLTFEQAANMGSGKPITGPNGEMMFMTPQSIFGNQAGVQAQPAPQQSLDLFADQPQQVPQAGSQPNPAPVQPTVAPQPVPQAAAQPNGPIMITGPKAANDDERKAAGFTDRLTSADSILADLGNVGTDTTENYLARVPFGIGNHLVSDKYQQYDQARRDFINAQLRRESGAAIADSEYDNANQQYFPQPGNGPDTIKQKADARRLAIENMKRSAGPTYKPQHKVGNYTIEKVSP